MEKPKTLALADFYRLYPDLKGDPDFQAALAPHNIDAPREASAPRMPKKPAPVEVLDPQELAAIGRELAKSPRSPLSTLWRYLAPRVAPEPFQNYVASRYFPHLQSLSGNLFTDLQQEWTTFSGKITWPAATEYFSRLFQLAPDRESNSCTVYFTLSFKDDRSLFEYYAKQMRLTPEALFLKLSQAFQKVVCLDQNPPNFGAVFTAIEKNTPLPNLSGQVTATSPVDLFARAIDAKRIDSHRFVGEALVPWYLALAYKNQYGLADLSQWLISQGIPIDIDFSHSSEYFNDTVEALCKRYGYSVHKYSDGHLASEVEEKLDFLGLQTGQHRELETHHLLSWKGVGDPYAELYLTDFLTVLPELYAMDQWKTLFSQSREGKALLALLNSPAFALSPNTFRDFCRRWQLANALTQTAEAEILGYELEAGLLKTLADSPNPLACLLVLYGLGLGPLNRTRIGNWLERNITALCSRISPPPSENTTASPTDSNIIEIEEAAPLLNGLDPKVNLQDPAIFEKLRAIAEAWEGHGGFNVHLRNTFLTAVKTIPFIQEQAAYYTLTPKPTLYPASPTSQSAIALPLPGLPLRWFERAAERQHLDPADFRKLDTNGDGHLRFDELRRLPDTPMHQAALSDAIGGRHPFKSYAYLQHYLANPEADFIYNVPWSMLRGVGIAALARTHPDWLTEERIDDVAAVSPHTALRALGDPRVAPKTKARAAELLRQWAPSEVEAFLAIRGNSSDLFEMKLHDILSTSRSPTQKLRDILKIQISYLSEAIAIGEAIENLRLPPDEVTKILQETGGLDPSRISLLLFCTGHLRDLKADQVPHIVSWAETSPHDFSRWFKNKVLESWDFRNTAIAWLPNWIAEIGKKDPRISSTLAEYLFIPLLEKTNWAEDALLDLARVSATTNNKTASDFLFDCFSGNREDNLALFSALWKHPEVAPERRGLLREVLDPYRSGRDPNQVLSVYTLVSRRILDLDQAAASSLLLEVDQENPLTCFALCAALYQSDPAKALPLLQDPRLNSALKKVALNGDQPHYRDLSSQSDVLLAIGFSGETRLRSFISDIHLHADEAPLMRAFSEAKLFADPQSLDREWQRVAAFLTPEQQTKFLALGLEDFSEIYLSNLWSAIRDLLSTFRRLIEILKNPNSPSEERDKLVAITNWLQKKLSESSPSLSQLILLTLKHYLEGEASPELRTCFGRFTQNDSALSLLDRQAFWKGSHVLNYETPRLPVVPLALIGKSHPVVADDKAEVIFIEFGSPDNNSHAEMVDNILAHEGVAAKGILLSNNETLMKSLADSLETLLKEPVQYPNLKAISLSIAGFPNSLFGKKDAETLKNSPEGKRLQAALNSLNEKGIPLVAAAANEGDHGPETSLLGQMTILSVFSPPILIAGTNTYYSSAGSLFAKPSLAAEVGTLDRDSGTSAAAPRLAADIAKVGRKAPKLTGTQKALASMLAADPKSELSSLDAGRGMRNTNRSIWVGAALSGTYTEKELETLSTELGLSREFPALQQYIRTYRFAFQFFPERLWRKLLDLRRS